MSRAKLVAALGGGAMLLGGVLGFVPGVTTHYSELQFAHGSHAQLFGVVRLRLERRRAMFDAELGGCAE